MTINTDSNIEFWRKNSNIFLKINGARFARNFLSDFQTLYYILQFVFTFWGCQFVSIESWKRILLELEGARYKVPN